MDRVNRIAQHVVAAASSDAQPLNVQPTAATMAGHEKSDDDVVICCAIRTPICKAKRGDFKDTPCEELLTPLFKAILEKTKIDPKIVGDIQIGNASQPGAGAITSRMAQFMGGWPFEVSLATVNRQCSSGLQVFHAAMVPQMSFQDYLARLAKYYLCSDGCLLLALIYIDRLVKLHPDFVISNLNIHRLMSVSLMLAAKFQDDVFYKNSYYAKVAGLDVLELNRLEEKFLQLLRWQMSVLPSEYEEYLGRVLHLLRLRSL